MLQNGRNPELFAEALSVIPGGINTSLRRACGEIVFTAAQGATLTDAEGHHYIDYHLGFGPVVLGHNFPAVNNAILSMMQKLDIAGAGTTIGETALARKICQHVPSAEKVLFCNSGSEATYSAIRLARAVTGRKKIIKFQGCYHGWHDSVAMNLISSPDRVGKRDPLSAGSLSEVQALTELCAYNDLDGVEKTIAANRHQIAALIIEPVPHNVGCLLPEPGFLQGLRDLTRSHGIVLIFDEVITGFRHHLGGYQALCGVTPDLSTLGKALGNGFPISAVCGKRELMDRYSTHPDGDVLFAGTYNAHPWACAAALATIETLEKQDVHKRLFQLGNTLRQGLTEIADRLHVGATVAGFGSVYVVYFMDGPFRTYTDLLRNDETRFVAYRRALLERGIFELPMNLKRNYISFSHTDQHIQATLQAAEDSFRHICSIPVSRAGVLTSSR
jgi:glutamate-1-semialdehyde 2,1-aminomutase